jgi:glycosyltransferase involved in cell wall biosynthesis
MVFFPKVSIIIPCYNVPEKYISRAIASVQAQSFHDYEIIVVNDGSAKAYASTLERLCQGTEKARLIKITNSGVSMARNVGIEVARGEYIAFLDADDVLTSDFFERALTVAGNTNADLIIGGVKDTEKVYVPFLLPRTEKVRYTEYTKEKIRQDLCYRLISIRFRIEFPGGYIGRGPVARIIRRELVQDTMFDPTLTIGEDVVWNQEILKKCDTVCVVQEVWYGYWKNPQSASHRYNPQIIEECRKQIERIAEVTDLKDDAMYASYADRIYEHMKMFWFNYLEKEKRVNRGNYKAVIHRLYTEYPWQEIGTKRYYLQVGKKKRMVALLYHMHLFYTVFALKERIMPSSGRIKSVSDGQKEEKQFI